MKVRVMIQMITVMAYEMINTTYKINKNNENHIINNMIG